MFLFLYTSLLFGAKKPPKIIEKNARVLWASELDKKGEVTSHGACIDI